MNEYAKHFRDISESQRRNNGGGVLNGDGHDEVEGTRDELDQRGLTIHARCVRCGRPNPMLVSYYELTCIANQVPPIDPDVSQPWTYHQGARGFQPPIACKCGQRISVVLYPAEAKKKVLAAINAQLAAPQQIQAYEQQAQSMRRR